MALNATSIFNNDETNKYDKQGSGGTSEITHDLVAAVGKKICEDRRFIVKTLSWEFLQVSHRNTQNQIDWRCYEGRCCASVRMKK